MQDQFRRREFCERKPSTELTPAYEDFGLFKSDVLPVEASLTPITHRNSRNDLVVRGFAKAKQRFEVVFAGRRAAMAGPLLHSLSALRTAYIKQTKGHADDQDAMETLRLPVVVEGSWRRMHWTDASGWHRHINQLVAARWSMMGADGRALTFGVSPSHLVRPDLPIVGNRGAGEGGHIQQAAGGN